MATTSPPLHDLLRRLREHRFAGGLACPRCGGRAIRWGGFHGRQRYRCKACDRTFSDLTGTALAYSKRLQDWEPYLAFMRSAAPVRVAAGELRMHHTTAWRWRHRILAALRSSDGSRLEGFIEIMELRLAHSNKGARDLWRPARRHGVQGCFWYEPRVFVSVACDRRGAIAARVVPGRPPEAGQLGELAERFGGPPVTVLVGGRLGPYRRLCSELHGRDGATRCISVPSEPPPGSRTLLHRGTVVRFLRAWRFWLIRFRGVSSHYLLNYLWWFQVLERRREHVPGVWALTASVR